jgi:molybdate transport system ATP-binding protein
VSLEAAIRARMGGLSLEASISVADNEVVVLLGPNGAGKTTLLRAMAGLVPLDEGRVVVDGRTLEDVAARRRVPTEQRPIGFVFQDYLLFPHLSVLENVAFGLRAQGVARADARARAATWLERMSLSAYARARPGSLSGGQAQRIALARALAIGPKLLLLDEPLSALDAGARAEVRRVLKRHLASFDGARLVVTHDPLEAMVLADRLVVLEAGRIVQSGSMNDLRERPRSNYVANLVGLNLYRGRVTGDVVALPSGGRIVVPGAGPGDVFVSVHPRAVALYRRRPEGSPRNVWRGRVRGIDVEGERVRIRIDGSVPVVAEITAHAASDLSVREGDELWASVKASEVTAYPA